MHSQEVNVSRYICLASVQLIIRENCCFNHVILHMCFCHLLNSCAKIFNDQWFGVLWHQHSKPCQIMKTFPLTCNADWFLQCTADYWIPRIWMFSTYLFRVHVRSSSHWKQLLPVCMFTVNFLKLSCLWSWFTVVATLRIMKLWITEKFGVVL